MNDMSNPPTGPAVKGDWMLAKSGQRVDLWDIAPEQIKIEDIAWHLTGVMRFTGAGERNISVAEHSLRVHQMVKDAGGSPVAQLWALMHDAHEAYVGDVSTPLKRTIAEVAGKNVIKAIEARLDLAITKAFDLPKPTDADTSLVKLADYWAMAFEKERLLPDHKDWSFDLSKSPFADPGGELEFKYDRDDLAGEFQWTFDNAMDLVRASQRVQAALKG